MPTINDIPQELRVNLKEKTVLVFTYGTTIEFAKTLSKFFKKVYVFTQWRANDPTVQQYKIGFGLEGVEVVHNLFDYIDKVDLFCFFDLHDGDFQNYLVSQGKLVWGARKGQEIENDRAKMLRYMKSIGLYVPHYVVITGTDKLKEYLKDNDNVYVKVNSTYRGDMETFHSQTYEDSEPIVDKLEHSFGKMKEIIEFVVTDAYDDAVESGLDPYTVDGQFPTRVLAGIEIKDECYVGKMMDWKDISPKLTNVLNKLAPALKAYKFRSQISTETRISKSKPEYTGDLTCRQPSPPGELQQLMFKNWGEIVYYGAMGYMIDPITEHEYGGQAIIYSFWGKDNWQPISIPDKFRDNVKLKNVCKLGDRYYCSPCNHSNIIGAIVVEGDSFEEVTEKLTEISKEVNGYELDIKCTSAEKIIDSFKKLEEFDVKIL